MDAPPRQPRFEAFDFAQFRSRHVDLNAVTFSKGICGRCRCGFQRRFARNIPTFAVAKELPPNRSLEDVVNVTSHRSPHFVIAIHAAIGTVRPQNHITLVEQGGGQLHGAPQSDWEP